MSNVRIARPAGQSALIESLEARQLMSVSYGTNLIVNPGAESYAGTATGYNAITPTGWTANSNPTVVPYGTSGFLTSTSPGPTVRGKAFFSGGPNSASTDFFQTIDLSSIGSAIDAKQVKLALSAYLGGFTNQRDAATLFVNFQNASKFFVSQVSVGPVTPANRANITELLLKSTTGTVPTGARFAQVQLHFERLDGTYNDAYADNLSLVLTGPTATTGSINGGVVNDLNGDGLKTTGETGLAGVKVFLDKNGNGTADLGEPATTTSSLGTYSFSNLPVGTYKVKEVVPATFRATSANPVIVNVTAGGTAAAYFFVSQTALITGRVFNDANGSKIKDPTEAGLAGVVVYLDFNNNGQLDFFELKTTTDANGNYKFVVPFGTYFVRQIKPTNFNQTIAPVPLTLAKGAVSNFNNFGDKHV